METKKISEETIEGGFVTAEYVPTEADAQKNCGVKVNVKEERVEKMECDKKGEVKIPAGMEENASQSLNQRLDNTPKTFKEDRPKYILLEKTKALYTMLHSYLELFPKSEKFTLRQKIEESVLESIRIIILQNYQQTDGERKKLILNFLSEFYILEVLLQQAVVFKYISYDGYDKIMPLVREINAFALARYKNLNYSGVAMPSSKEELKERGVTK